MKGPDQLTPDRLVFPGRVALERVANNRRAFGKLQLEPVLAVQLGHNGLVPSTGAGGESWTRSGLDLLISVDRRGRGVGAALQRAVREAIRAGRLRPGDPLPSTRALARDLGVARGTVVEAYEQLAAEGWLVARHGLGTQVASLPAAPRSPVEPPTAPAPRHDLRPGHADPSSFPRQAWAAAMRRVLAEAPANAGSPYSPAAGAPSSTSPPASAKSASPAPPSSSPNSNAAISRVLLGSRRPDHGESSCLPSSDEWFG